MLLLLLSLSALEKVLPHASLLGLHLFSVTSGEEDDVGVDI